MKKNIACVPVWDEKNGYVSCLENFCGAPLIYWPLSVLGASEEIEEVYVLVADEAAARKIEGWAINKVKVQNIDSLEQETPEVWWNQVFNNNIISGEDCMVMVSYWFAFITTTYIKEAIRLFHNNKKAVVSGLKYTGEFRNEEGRLLPGEGGVFKENKGIYVNYFKHIKEGWSNGEPEAVMYEMPSFTNVDWNSEQGFRQAEKDMYLHFPISLKEKVRNIKMFLSDVDGVLTDACMYYTEYGDEIKKFCTYDGVGFKILKKHGIKTGMLTSEDRELNQNRAEKLKLDYIYQGVGNKLDFVKELCIEQGISLEEVAYIGDDINCADLLRNVGIAACPSNALEKVRKTEGIIQLPVAGGQGAVRHFIENYFLPVLEGDNGTNRES